MVFAICNLEFQRVIEQKVNFHWDYPKSCPFGPEFLTDLGLAPGAIIPYKEGMEKTPPQPKSIQPIPMTVIVDHLMRSRAARKTDFVVVAFCFSDELALKACLEGCQETRSIPVIMATMNQVNSDGGYAGLTAARFVEKINRLAEETGYAGPIVFGRDHGGPFIVEAHKQWTRPEAMAWVKQNIMQDLEAGFTCWHADGTSGRDDELIDGKLPVNIIADTTLELIEFCEKMRKNFEIAPISYEVGSEEQQGGLTAPKMFDRYLGLLKTGMNRRGLEDARIDFVVAQTGTHMKLHFNQSANAFELLQTGFQPQLVESLDAVAQKYRSPHLGFLFTQHYSDHITPVDALALRRFRAGKANFGPEMTMPELEFLLEWEHAEQAALKKQGSIGDASKFRETMLRHLDRRPDFWRKFIPIDLGFQKIGKDPSIFDFPCHVQDALIVFRGRYVKSQPSCQAAAEKLLSNLVSLGIHENPARAVIEQIKDSSIRPRLEQFQMTGILEAIQGGLNV